MLDIIREFALEGTPIGMLPFGSGHINQTWLVATSQSRLYILQCVNTNTFKDPVGLMNNIVMVTDHLKKKDPTPGHVLNLIPTREGDMYILQPEQGLWRVYDYIIGGTSLNQAETPEDFRRSGEAFGHFQRQLADNRQAA